MMTRMDGADTLHHIECGIMVLDGAQRVRFWNRWLEQHSGIEAAAAEGRRLDELFPDGLPTVLQDAIGDACRHRLSRLLSHQLHPQLLPLRRLSAAGVGSPLFHSMLLRPLADSDGLTLVQLHDNTNAVRRERHLRDKEQAVRKLHQVLSEEKQFIDTVLKTISALVVVTDRFGRIVSINRSCEQLTGLGQAEVVAQPLKVLFSIDTFNSQIDSPWQHHEPRPFTCRMYNAAGEVMHLRWTVKPVGEAGQPPRYLIYTGQDITERERADALLRLEREILEMATAGESPAQTLDHICLALERQLEQARVAVLQLTAEERLAVINAPGLPEAFCRRLEALQTEPIARLVMPGLQSGQLQIFSARGDGARWQPWLSLARDYRMAACWLMPIQTAQHMPQSLFALFPGQHHHPSAHEQMVIQRIAHLTALILERHQQQERIRYLALYDPLTGLANRSLLSEQLLRNINRARRERQRFALLFFDLDGFKQVNDSHGHDAGDALLSAIGQRLQARLRATDTGARIGGDEFVVLLETVAGEAAARLVAEQVQALVCEPVAWGEGLLQVSASIGLALYPDDGDTADTLLTHADNAMYCAKARGKACITRLTD